MTRSTGIALACGLFLLSNFPAAAQQTPNLAMTAPDQVAWQIFIQANTRAGGTNSMFETWASDTDTFKANPAFPAGAEVHVAQRPILPNARRQVLQRAGQLLPALPPGAAQGALEESRRNKAGFDFIVSNNLYKRSGLQAAFGKTLSFPVDAVEVKANWVPVLQIPTFTNGKVSVGQVGQLYHVNATADGTQYALVSMHVISKLVPNWTWATFEHKDNPQRCDIIGCADTFGSTTPFIPPNPGANGYPDCAKTPALKAMLSGANIEPVYTNYCLKGSQVDFIDNTGLATRLGNSVTEAGFVDTSSCITCHSRSAWNPAGTMTSSFGFNDDGTGPLGPTQPSWYWNSTGNPPIFEGMPGLTRTGTSADFVWSIPFCAFDDTRQPAASSPCVGK
jgi:hypothetical protein